MATCFSSGCKWSIEFLGFEFRRAISRKFKPIIRRPTSRKRLKASIAAFTVWIKTKRNKKISKLMTTLRAKLVRTLEKRHWKIEGPDGAARILKLTPQHPSRAHAKTQNSKATKLRCTFIKLTPQKP